MKEKLQKLVGEIQTLYREEASDLGYCFFLPFLETEDAGQVLHGGNFDEDAFATMMLMFCEGEGFFLNTIVEKMYNLRAIMMLEETGNLDGLDGL